MPLPLHALAIPIMHFALYMVPAGTLLSNSYSCAGRHPSSWRSYRGITRHLPAGTLLSNSYTQQFPTHTSGHPTGQCGPSMSFRATVHSSSVEARISGRNLLILVARTRKDLLQRIRHAGGCALCQASSTGRRHGHCLIRAQQARACRERAASESAMEEQAAKGAASSIRC